MASLLLLLVALVAAWAEPEPATEPPGSPDLFELVQTFELDNGLTVHIADVPGDPTATVSVMTPLGYGDDPRGMEELAHLTEHLMFTPPEGVSEEDFRERITGVGGSYNGRTHQFHSEFYATVPREHLLLAIDWLHHVLSPRPFSQGDLDRERTVIELERAQPWSAGDWLVRALFWRPWMQGRDRWERVLGYEDPMRGRLDYPYRSLQRIELEDVRAFHEAQISARAMQVFIGGDLELDLVLGVLGRTLSTLPGGEPEVIPVAAGPLQTRSRCRWLAGEALVTYRIDRIFADPDDQEWLQLLVLRAWLDQRLEKTLRHGEDKLVYTVRTGVYSRHRSASLWIKVEVDPARYADVVEIIGAELDSLLVAGIEPGVFDEGRVRIVNRLVADNQTALDLGYWHEESYTRAGPAPFPDVLEVARTVGQDDLSALLDRSVSETLTIRPRPGGGLPWLPGYLGLIVLVGVVLYRLWRPPSVGHRLRYARWFWGSWRDVFLLVLIAPVVVLLIGPWLHGIWWLFGLVERVDSLALHIWVETLLIGAHAVAFATFFAHLPARLLVLTDEVRLQMWFSRARRVPLDGLQVERGVWLHQAWRREGWVVPNNMYGVLIKTPEGWPILTYLRDVDEAMEAIESVRDRRPGGEPA